MSNKYACDSVSSILYKIIINSSSFGYTQTLILVESSRFYQVVTHGDEAGFEVVSIHDSCSLLQGQRETNGTRRRGERQDRRGRIEEDKV